MGPGPLPTRLCMIGAGEADMHGALRIQIFSYTVNQGG